MEKRKDKCRSQNLTKAKKSAQNWKAIRKPERVKEEKPRAKKGQVEFWGERGGKEKRVGGFRDYRTKNRKPGGRRSGVKLELSKCEKRNNR